MFGFSAQVSGVWGVGYGGSEGLRSALGGLEFSASKGLGSALWSLGSREAHGCGVCAWVPGVWGSGSALVGLRFRGPRVCCPGRLVGSPSADGCSGPWGLVRWAGGPGGGSAVRSGSGSRCAGRAGRGVEHRWGLEGLVRSEWAGVC